MQVFLVSPAVTTHQEMHAHLEPREPRQGVIHLFRQKVGHLRTRWSRPGNENFDPLGKPIPTFDQ